MLFDCDECGEEFDPEDEVQEEFATWEGGEYICALCNSDVAE